MEVDVLEKFYQVTKDALTEAKNDVRSFPVSQICTQLLMHLFRYSDCL